MKSDDLIVLVALAGLGYVVYTRMRPAAAAAPVTTPIYVGQQPTGAPYKSSSVKDWAQLIGSVGGFVKDVGPLAGFGGRDYVAETDVVQHLINDSTTAGKNDSVVLPMPSWLSAVM